MDIQTKLILQRFKSHSKIKNLLTKTCYALIVGGIFIYIFYGLNGGNNIKVVTDYKDNPKKYRVEKIMTNPRLKLQYSEGQLYDIQAKKAFHKDENEVFLYDVFAEGKIGKITAGELEINDSGDHLVFTKNPVLILNQTKK
jgi:hypothetical protein